LRKANQFMSRPPKPGTLRSALHEMRSGTFLGNAQLRSRRRKSPWNLLLLLIFPVWAFLWMKILAILWNLALFARGAAIPATAAGWLVNPGWASRPMSWAGALHLFAPCIPVLVGSMVLGNFLIYLIPPARRAMDNEDKAFPGTEYSTAQRTLGRFALVTLPIGLALSFLGAWLDVVR
jgi:hypothetical protein